jgi:hypothetical protein
MEALARLRIMEFVLGIPTTVMSPSRHDAWLERILTYRVIGLREVDLSAGHWGP